MPSTNSRAHTAGPWHVNAAHAKRSTSRQVLAADGSVIAELPGWHHKNSIDTCARLIAAAPDLLAALENLISCCEVHPAFTKPTNTITRGRMEAARAAIAAAKGDA